MTLPVNQLIHEGSASYTLMFLRKLAELSPVLMLVAGAGMIAGHASEHFLSGGKPDAAAQTSRFFDPEADKIDPNANAPALKKIPRVG